MGYHELTNVNCTLWVLEALLSLSPALDQLCQSSEIAQSDHTPLLTLLKDVRSKVREYKVKNKKKKEDKENETAMKQNMDEIGVKMWNIATQLKANIEPHSGVGNETQLIASLYHTSFRLLEASSEAKPRPTLVMRLLQSVSCAITSLAMTGELTTAEELTRAGAELQQSLTVSEGASVKEKNDVLIKFQLARVDLEIARRNDNLALSLMMRAADDASDIYQVNFIHTITLLPLTKQQYQAILSKYWSIARQITRARSEDKAVVSFTTAPIEWLQEALSLNKKMRDLRSDFPVLRRVQGAALQNIGDVKTTKALRFDLPDVDRVQVVILQNIAREHINNASDDPQSIEKAKSTLNKLIKLIGTEDQALSFENYLLLVHLWSRDKKQDQDSVGQSFDRLINVMIWKDDNVYSVIAQVQALSSNFPAIQLSVLQSLLKRAFIADDGRRYIGTVVYEGILTAHQQFSTSPNDVHSVVVAMLEAIDKSGAQKDIDATRATAIQMVLMRLADGLYKNGDKNEEAAQWYLLAGHPALASAGSERTSLCRRKGALCFIKSDSWLFARGIIKECSSGEAATQYLTFLIATKYCDEEMAQQAISKMVECPDLESGQIASLASMTEKEEESPIRLAGLRALLASLNMPRLRDELKIQSMTVIRCLIQISLKQDIAKEGSLIANEILGYAESAIRLLTEDVAKYAAQKAAIAWLYKTVYNFAIEGSDSVAPSILADLFSIAAQLIFFYGQLQGDTIDSKMEDTRICAMFACLSGKLLHYRGLPDGDEKTMLQGQLLQYLPSVQGGLPSLSSSHKTDQLNDLVTVYQMEIACDMSDWEQVANIASAACDPKHVATISRKLELMANLVLDYPNCPTSVSSQILEAIIVSCDVAIAEEVARFARWVRGITVLLLHADGAHQDVRRSQWYVSRALEIIRTSAGASGYPHDEIQWLSSTSWNQGLQQYHSSRQQDALWWCGISIEIGECLPKGMIPLTQLRRQYKVMLRQQKEASV
ncbi:uncharacterized protein I303_107037 [Kwoniella dejecticola CBS 10117]|uniref:Protein ZIP4 homolog n=1 Tax=Kwoniella dejecticola CBS 10117 TaxID=1296121 RepID=A0AAJ8KVS0_9TREE